MHKSVFIILAGGTLFHQVHDSTRGEETASAPAIFLPIKHSKGKKMSGCHQIPRIMLPGFM